MVQCMASPTRLRLLAVVALLLAACQVAPARAQGWFGNFFGGPPMPRRSAPPFPGYGGGYDRGGYNRGGYGPSDGYVRSHRHVQKRKPAPPAEEVAKDVPKAAPKNATMFVDVFGDSLGQMLADGLDDALADRAEVAVVHRAKGSTGLVASDFYDWPKSIEDLLGGRGARDADAKSAGDRTPDAAQKGDAKLPRIDVAVMMVGSNDKQAIREGGKTLAFGTPEWTAAYSRRVTAIDEAFRSHRIPLIWVGIPITKDDGFADAMASLNDVTREAAVKTGATYVDTWEAFSDDNGDFSSYGPDVNGQTVRLRSTDGIHFTKAGARKLAHFVDAHVRRALDGKIPAPQLPTADAPVAAAKPDAGPIRNLNEAPNSKGGTLAPLPGRADARPGAVQEEKTAKREPEALVKATIVRGGAVPIPAGRADDARWPAQGAPEP